MSVFTNVPFSLKMSIYPPDLPWSMQKQRRAAVDILNAEGSKPSGKIRVRKRHHEFEGSAVNIHFVIGEVCRIQGVAGFFVGDRQSGINRA